MSSSDRGAALCRDNSWGPGATLVSTDLPADWASEEVVRVTAVGEDHVLGRLLAYRRKRGPRTEWGDWAAAAGGEYLLYLNHRKWQPLTNEKRAEISNALGRPI